EAARRKVTANSLRPLPFRRNGIGTKISETPAPHRYLQKSEEWSCSNKKGGCICDLTLFPGQSSPTMSFPITPRNVGSSPNCKDNTQWFSSSAAEVSAPRTAGTLKGLFNSIVS